MKRTLTALVFAGAALAMTSPPALAKPAADAGPSKTPPKTQPKKPDALDSFLPLGTTKGEDPPSTPRRPPPPKR